MSWNDRKDGTVTTLMNLTSHGPDSRLVPTRRLLLLVLVLERVRVP